MAGTATMIGFNGVRANLYELNPPYQGHSWLLLSMLEQDESTVAAFIVDENGEPTDLLFEQSGFDFGIRSALVEMGYPTIEQPDTAICVVAGNGESKQQWVYDTRHWLLALQRAFQIRGFSKNAMLECLAMVDDEV